MKLALAGTAITALLGSKPAILLVDVATLDQYRFSAVGSLAAATEHRDRPGRSFSATSVVDQPSMSVRITAVTRNRTSSGALPTRWIKRCRETDLTSSHLA